MEIQSKDLKTAIIESTKINPSVNKIPSTLSPVIAPVIDVNPNHNRISNIVKANRLLNATSLTLYTTPTDKDFFVTGIQMSIAKDATATATVMRINATNFEDGSLISLARIDGFTLTAQTLTTQQSYPTPIKLSRGSTITINSDTGVANVVVTAVLTGYTVDNF